MEYSADFDRAQMQRALALAREAAENGEIPVGAVLTDGTGAVLAAARNRTEEQHSALAHAELLCIAEASQKKKSWRLSDCTLYVTLEPCPMCMGAIIHARISRVVFGAPDARAGACGSLLELAAYPLESHPQTEGGLMEEECRALLREFFRHRRAD